MAYYRCENGKKRKTSNEVVKEKKNCSIVFCSFIVVFGLFLLRIRCCSLHSPGFVYFLKKLLLIFPLFESGMSMVICWILSIHIRSSGWFICNFHEKWFEFYSCCGCHFFTFHRIFMKIFAIFFSEIFLHSFFIPSDILAIDLSYRMPFICILLLSISKFNHLYSNNPTCLAYACSLFLN